MKMEKKKDNDFDGIDKNNIVMIVGFGNDIFNIYIDILLLFKGRTSPSPGSPTARLLLEYEQHLRNTLAKGMDAESYSLHTFEAIISQSNENLCKNLTQKWL